MHAQFRLGAMYYEGSEVKLDKALAGYWFMQAAQAGLGEAQYQISRRIWGSDKGLKLFGSWFLMVFGFEMLQNVVSG